jgi:Zn-dependent protease with chaperone function
MLLGFAILIFGIRQIAAASGRTSESLSTGELRDRVFELAKKAGVSLKSLYVISSAKSRMANAFAAQGNTVMVTDYLLMHLTRREVDAVVAHELTHLKRQHVALRVIVFVAVMSTSLAIMQNWMRAGLVPLLAAILLLIYYLTARVNERKADAGAVKILGDPEAMITGLAKVTRLNKFPLRWSKWSEWLMTHPSTMRRAEAIARRAGIAPEKLAEILQAGTTGDSYYTLPAAIAAKVFSTKYKRSQGAKRSWTFAAIWTILPSAILAIASAVEFEGLAFFGAWIVAIVATFLVYLVAMDYLSLSGNGRLEKRLRARLKGENVIAREDGGMFVSFSPEGAPRLYDGSFSWDIGLLYLGAERIVYVGEEARFALRRQDTLDVRDVRGSPAWVRTGAVMIQWRDAAKDRSGAFLIRPQRARSLGDQRAAAEELTKRMEEWIDGRQAVTDELPDGNFGTPEVGAVTSRSPATMARGQTAMRSLMILGYMSAAAAVLCNLSFIGPFDGWYAVSATMILGVVQFVPYWRYREDADAPLAV